MMEEKVKKALKKVDAEYVEVHLEETEVTSVRYSGKEMDSIGTHFTRGGNVRAFFRGGWGFSSFNDVIRIGEAIQEACQHARQVARDGGGLAPANPLEDRVQVELEDDPREIPLSEKERIARTYNEIILASSKIQTSQVRYVDKFMRRSFYNTEGTALHEERIYCGISFSAIAKDGANIQTSFDSVGGTRGFKTVLGQEGKVERITKEAIDLLKAEKVEGGRYSVIVNPMLAGVFAHEAFGHLSEADHLDENERILKIMELGKRFGSEELSIVDDGTLKGERGSYLYDDEGVPAQKTDLIREGILVGRLHSRETAYKMGEPLTGNGRAINFRHPPIVRMSCTYIEPGEKSFEEMVSEVNEGIYAVDALGGQTQLEMFTFSAGKGYRIKDGKIGPMVRDVILTGNLFETLRNIDAIGNDLQHHGGLGGCGKDGQFPLPVSTGAPHIRIRNVTIGGK
ncbi:TldD/PmbA family protein [candidate division TA06 bacterium]|nr:TldD/PmbA family protein [candidate division TA06 bacterium]